MANSAEIPHATRQSQTAVSTQVSQTHRNCDDGREAGAASAASRAIAEKARMELRAAAKAHVLASSEEAEAEAGVSGEKLKNSKGWKLRAQNREVTLTAKRRLAPQARTKVTFM